MSDLKTTEYDLLVVGSGGGGLVATLAALRAGVRARERALSTP
ncbi:MAG: hypothetical protein JWQ20_3035 [Conexibacter sp.]|nr:hypothetical protein [Conexibacter sp.]